jgi:hypothetical protein
MMKNLFIPYELAVIAKEKGFDEPCLGWFLLEGGGAKSMFILEKCPKQDMGLCLSPLYQQLIDWLEEKYKIIISRDLDVDDDFAFNIILGRIDKYSYDEDKIKALNGAIKEAFNLTPTN